MSDTPETCEAVERWRQGKINIFDEMARLERERDEAHGALVAQDRRMIAAGHICGVPFEVFGCDWPDRVAEELIAVAKERDEARDTARWLYQHGMATLIEGASGNDWIKEEIK